LLDRKKPADVTTRDHRSKLAAGSLRAHGRLMISRAIHSQNAQAQALFFGVFVDDLSLRFSNHLVRRHSLQANGSDLLVPPVWNTNFFILNFNS
jgi:hypothetical protein